MSNTLDKKTLNEFQKLLTESFFDWARKQGRRNVSDQQFAKYLGVSAPSLNQWINGYRLPNFENAAKLADKLGPEIFDVLGYPRIVAVSDEELRFIIDHWGKLDEETKAVIHEHVKEEVLEHGQRRKTRGEQQGAVGEGSANPA